MRFDHLFSHTVLTAQFYTFGHVFSLYSISSRLVKSVPFPTPNARLNIDNIFYCIEVQNVVHIIKNALDSIFGDSHS
jgi:hypothetical protein